MLTFIECLLCAMHLTWVILLNPYSHPMRQIGLLHSFLQMWELRLKLRVGKWTLSSGPLMPNPMIPPPTWRT